jgi:phosphoribosylglycinamide formyltransferase-1
VLSVAVLISGTGSNLRALLEAAEDPDYPARVVVVGADREADGLAHAEAFGIPSFTVPYAHFATREEWGAELSAQLAVWQPDLVVLSGLMRLLPAPVVDEWAPNLVNTVVDAGVDSGPIVAQERVPVLDGDDEHTLHERIKPVERRLLIDVVRRVATGDLDLTSP